MEIFSYKIFSSWLFYFMLGHFALLVYLFWGNVKLAWEEFRKIDKKIWLMLLVVFLFGFYLRNSEYWMGTHTDGQVAQESAHLWVVYGEHVKACALGNYQECKLFEQVLAPPGYPFLIVLAHLIFGIHSLSASIISAVLSSLTILLVFLISYLLFKKEEAALYGALVFSLIPLDILYAHTGEPRPTGLFFIGLATLFYLLALKNNRLKTWLLATTCVSYAIYVRQENYVLVPLFFLFFLVFKWQAVKDFVKKIKEKAPDFSPLLSGLFLGLVFLLLQLPVLRWLLVDNPYSQEPSHGLDYYKYIVIPIKFLSLHFFNLSPGYNAFFHYNLIASIFFGLTIIFAVLKRGEKKEFSFVVGLLLVYFFIFSLMSLLFETRLSGDPQITRDYFRRTLTFHLPYAILAGYGFFLLWRVKNRFFLFLSLIGLALLLIFVSPIFLRSVTKEIKVVFSTKNYQMYFPRSLFVDARATKEGDYFLINPVPDYWKAIAKTPDDCLTISSAYMIVLNDYFKNNQRKTVSMEFIFSSTESLFLEEFKKSKCIIYLADYRCSDSYPGGNDFPCLFLKKHLSLKPLFSEGKINVFEATLKTN